MPSELDAGTLPKGSASHFFPPPAPPRSPCLYGTLPVGVNVAYQRAHTRAHTPAHLNTLTCTHTRTHAHTLTRTQLFRKSKGCVHAEAKRFIFAQKEGCAGDVRRAFASTYPLLLLVLLVLVLAAFRYLFLLVSL